MIIPVILAGGSGTRLWPLSRQLYPKQFLPLVNGRTLFQETALRLSKDSDIAPPIVVCNEDHRFMVAEQMREMQLKPSKIILEPVGRNTAPAVYIAAQVAREIDPEAILLVLPADHHIRDLDKLLETIRVSKPVAETVGSSLSVSYPAMPRPATVISNKARA